MYYSPCKEVQACNYRSETSENTDSAEKSLPLEAAWSVAGCRWKLHPLLWLWDAEMCILWRDRKDPSSCLSIAALRRPNTQMPLHLHPHTPPVQSGGGEEQPHLSPCTTWWGAEKAKPTDRHVPQALIATELLVEMRAERSSTCRRLSFASWRRAI